MSVAGEDPAGSPVAALAARVGVDVHGGHPVPTVTRALLATVVALAGSLGADALLVVAGQAAFPRTRGYQHFRFGDYAPLTVIGVLGACLAWPLACWLTSQPRRLVGRAAVVVTVVLLLPDAAIWAQGQPGRAVAVLVAMHLAIAVVTYLAIASVGRPTRETSTWAIARTRG